jgi:hypothetical protein
VKATPFPQQSFAPTGRYISKRSSKTWEITPQEKRKYLYETVGQPWVVYEDWNQVDRERGDLLYVGVAASLLNRLHPTSHAMWSVVHTHHLFPRIRIAIWSMQPERCLEIEAWIARNYHPLWSGTSQRPKSDWLWRAPDAVLPPRTFDPFCRSKPPFAYHASGVYAWVLAPKKLDSGWLERIVVAGAESRRTKEKPCGPTYPFFCHNCCARFRARPAQCPYCGKTEAQAFSIERALLERALDE